MGRQAGHAHTHTPQKDLIIHGLAHRSTNGAAMPTAEDDQDSHFFFNQHPERGATPLPRRAQPLVLLFRSNPPLRGGGQEQGARNMEVGGSTQPAPRTQVASLCADPHAK